MAHNRYSSAQPSGENRVIEAEGKRVVAVPPPRPGGQHSPIHYPGRP